LNPNEQRNRQSKATGCKWRVNGNLPKNSLRISFTTVVDEHNHQMIPSPSTNIAKYRKLGEDMIQFINFCVQNGTTGAQTIVRLLRGKFPERKIHQKNLYNAIQAAKKKLASRIEFDASDLMKFLYSQQTDDSRWFIEAKFDGIERRLCGLLWMTPDQQFLWTRYHDVLFFDTTSRTNKYNMMACFFAMHLTLQLLLILMMNL
jgi:hypothetical protein